MAYNNPNASYFRPPPETFNMFIDLTNDEDDDEETLPRSQRPSHVPPQTPLFIKEGRALPQISSRGGRRRPAFNIQSPHKPKEPRHEARHDTYSLEDDADLLPKVPTLTAQGRLPPKALRGANPPQRPPAQGGGTQSSPKSQDSYDDYGAAFPLQTRYQSSYARARPAARFPEFSAFASPNDKKKAKQVERVAESEGALRKFLKEFPDDTKLLAKLPQLEKYKQKLDREDELLNAAEAKWVYEVGRVVERRRVAIESKAFEEQIKSQTSCASRKRKRRDASSSPSRYSTPTRPSTGGKTIPGYVAEIGDESSDSDDGQDRQRGQKTIEGWNGAGVSAFNIQEALAETSESEESDGSDNSSDEESGEESSDDNDSDASVEPDAEPGLGLEAEAEAKLDVEAEAEAELEL